MITHVVMFKFHDPNDAFEARDRVKALRGRVPAIRSLTAGVHAARTESEWHMALVSTVDDWDALEAYRTHPAHVEYLDWIRPLVKERAAVDYD